MLDSSIISVILKGVIETLEMVLISTTIGYIFGLPLGIALYISDEDGIKPNKVVYRILDFIVNIGRSIPFIILLVLIIPFTKLLVGKSYGTAATIVPLIVGVIPYIGRIVEGSLKEVDHGVIEAAQSMGASTLDIILKVLIVEARVALVNGFTTTLGVIIGYSAMAGTVGGGGLGDIAIRYGYHRYDTITMLYVVVVIVAITQLFQLIGTSVARKIDKRKH